MKWHSLHPRGQGGEADVEEEHGGNRPGELLNGGRSSGWRRCLTQGPSIFPKKSNDEHELLHLEVSPSTTASSLSGSKSRTRRLHRSEDMESNSYEEISRKSSLPQKRNKLVFSQGRRIFRSSGRVKTLRGRGLNTPASSECRTQWTTPLTVRMTGRPEDQVVCTPCNPYSHL